MNILHINIGRPPFYTGGSVLASDDLMISQIRFGHKVSLMYPGHSTILGLTRLSIHHSIDKIDLIEIVNPLPVALMAGIGHPAPFLRQVDPAIFKQYFTQAKIDIIHVHSLMGIPLAVLIAAKQLNIKLLFSTHDYYPICPRCTLIDVNGEICETHDALKCALCNQGAGLPALWERVIRARSYQYLKYSALGVNLRRWGRHSLESNQRAVIKTKVDLNQRSVLPENVQDYVRLIEQNDAMMQMMDLIHCNSNISKAVYLDHYPNQRFEMIPLSQGTMPNRFSPRSLDGVEFRIGYVGGDNVQKGIGTLLNAFSNLPVTGPSWSLILWGDDYCAYVKPDVRIVNKGRYSKSQRDEVFASMDVLIVPSIWFETFGFVVQEALAFGIPVICSSRVGAKILIEKLSVDLVYDSKNPLELRDKIVTLSDRETYSGLIDEIHQSASTYQYDHFVDCMDKLYRSLISEENA